MAFSFSQMAQFVTLEMGLFDDDSANLANLFLDKAYRLLWDKYPWKDTDTYATTTVFGGIPDAPYPAGMERLISLRARTVASGFGDTPDFVLHPGSAARMLEPVDGTFLIQSDPYIFERTGAPAYYEDISTATNKQLRLYPIPANDTELLWNGKLTVPDFDANAFSLIRNIDEVLIAYAYCDMLQRQRQYAKADLKRKEAMELEANAWNLEQQQANKPRVIKTTTVAGNSLLELTDAVCALCGQWTPDIRILIKEFLRRNYQQCYDLFLWPESLVVVNVSYAGEQVVMPHYVDRILGIRGNSKFRLAPMEAGLILDVTPTAFEDFGDPVSYTTLTPVAVNTLPSSLSALTLASTSDDDHSNVMIRGEAIASGQVYSEQVTLTGRTPVTTNYAYDIPLTIAKDQTTGDVTVNAAIDMASLAVIPAYVREQKHQRIWLRPFPETPSLSPMAQLLVLAKRSIVPLISDQDTPIITGVQQILIAGAAADLYLHLGKADLATQYQIKADASVKVLQAKNTDQAANSPRFVPEIEPYAYVHNAMLWSK